MPPKKRKAGAPTNAGRPKKVRTGEESVTGDAETTTNLSSGRPKRSLIGEPQYNFTRRRLTAAQKAQIAPTSPMATKTTLKKRGRPPKIKDEQTNSASSATSNSQVKSDVLTPSPKKKVGRPCKSLDTRFTRVPPTQVPSRLARQSTREAARSGKTVTKTTKSAASTTKKVATAPDGRGRGRPKGTKFTVNSAASPVANESEVDRVFDDESDGADTISELDDGRIVDEDGRQYWLMKAEPNSRIEKGVDVKFSIDDLMEANEPEAWDGVRNYGARNNMRSMRKGDLAFFYHSNCAQPGIVGVMRIVQEHSVDESAFNPDHPYYDAGSSRDKPRWDVVHVAFVKKFSDIVDLKQLKAQAGEDGPLRKMQLVRQARLSVQSVTPQEWRFILDLAGEEDLMEADFLEEDDEARYEEAEDRTDGYIAHRGRLEPSKGDNVEGKS